MAISLLDKKMVELKDSIKEGFLSIPSVPIPSRSPINRYLTSSANPLSPRNSSGLNFTSARRANYRKSSKECRISSDPQQPQRPSLPSGLVSQQGFLSLLKNTTNLLRGLHKLRNKSKRKRKCMPKSSKEGQRNFRGKKRRQSSSKRKSC